MIYLSPYVFINIFDVFINIIVTSILPGSGAAEIIVHPTRKVKIIRCSILNVDSSIQLILKFLRQAASPVSPNGKNGNKCIQMFE